MFCKKCGKKLIDGSRFCQGCGTMVESITQTSTQGQNKTIVGNQQYVYPGQPMQPVLAPNIVIPRKRHGFGGLIAAFIVIFVLASALEVYIKFFVKGPDDCAVAFMNAMSAYDLEEMCAYMQKEDRAIFEAEIKMLGLAGDFTNSLISEAIGIDLGFDFSDLLGGTSGYAALYEMLGGELPKFERIHVESITYVRGEEDDIVKKNPFDFLELQKVLCKKAYVQVSGTYDGQAFNDTILMVREGFGDWKVSHESLGSVDFLGLEQMYEQIQ